MGRGQVVRHMVLVHAFGGSNPSAPAKLGQWATCPLVELVLDKEYLNKVRRSGEATSSQTGEAPPLSPGQN